MEKDEEDREEPARTTDESNVGILFFIFFFFRSLLDSGRTYVGFTTVFVLSFRFSANAFSAGPSGEKVSSGQSVGR